MSVSVTLNGIVYQIPVDDETGWGQQLTAYLAAIPTAIDEGSGSGIEFNDAEGNPAALGTSADGTSVYAARRDHVHAHGNQLGGALHSAATTSTAGFLAALDKKTLTSLGIYALTGGGTTSSITAGLTAMRSEGLKHLHLGDGTWTIDCGALADDSALITVNDGETITSNGKGRTTLAITNATSGSGGGCAVFRTDVDACNVVFDNLYFLGENTGPYVSATFNENECISIHWAGTSTDIVVKNCHFESLEGFAVHDRQGTTNERIHVYDCTGLELGNTLANCNGNLCHFERNTVKDGEGFECSGYGVVIANNVIRDATGVGITIGGNQTPGELFPANVIATNTIDGSTGVGITVTDGANATVVSNNTIRRCDDGGILISHSINPVEGCILIGNILESNCADPGANLNGIDIRSGSRHLVYGNIAVDLGETGYSQKYGLNLTAPDCVVYGNYFDNVNHDASYGTGATNTREAGNVYANNTMEIISTATMTPQSLTAKAATDAVWTTRYNSGSGLPERAYFSIAGDGKHTWGNNLDLLSAQNSNLYRSAADTLKTDGAFIAVGSITGGTLVGTTSTTSAAFISSSSNPASAGQLRLASADTIKWRNNANGADVTLGKDASDNLEWAGVDVLTQTNTVTGITNKTFTSPTINSGALSGTFTGDHTYTGLATFNRSAADAGVITLTNQLDSGFSSVTATNEGGTYKGGFGYANGTVTNADQRDKLCVDAATGVDFLWTVNGVRKANFISTGNVNLEGSLGFGQVPTALLDLGTSLANTKLALYGGGTAAGFGVQSGDVRFHLDFATSKFSWRPTPSGASIMELSGAGVLNTASGGNITMNGVQVLNQTNTVSGITNKTFTSLTHSGTLALGTSSVTGSWSFSGTPTIGGNVTLSGNNTYSGTSAIQGVATFSAKQVHLVQNSITAFAGGGQASATALTGEQCFVTTCATNGDSVKLPVAVAGYQVMVFNAGAASCDVFPQSGSNAGAGVDTAVAVAAGTGKVFYAQTTTQWRSI